MRNTLNDIGRFSTQRLNMGLVAGVDQLFRICLTSFYLLIIHEAGQPSGMHRDVTFLLYAYATYLFVIIVAQNLSPAVHEWQRKASVWVDLAFFFAYNCVGPVSLFNITFLWTAFMIGFRWGLESGRRLLFLNVSLYVLSEVVFLARFMYHGKPAGRYFSSVVRIGEDPGTLLVTLITNATVWLVIIVVIGHVLARWGDFERLAVRRQALIKRIREFLKQGMGINVFCDFLMRELVELLNASRIQIVLFQSDGTYQVRSLVNEQEGPRLTVEEADDEGLNPSLKSRDFSSPILLSKKGDSVDAFRLENGSWRRIPDLDGPQSKGMEDGSCIEVSLAGTNTLLGKMVVHSGDKRKLGFDDALFLQELLSVAALFLDNLRLMDEIAVEAAETERKKIALDIHDRVVQPYVAVQMGISGVRKKYEHEGRLGETDFERLMRISDDGVADLRQLVRQMKGADKGGQAFIPAVERFLKRFSGATGLAVDFRHDKSLAGLYGSFSTDLFQMIAEGVSNVYRHSESPIIRISLTGEERRILLVIEDEGKAVEDVGLLIPKSLSERTELRGGFLRVSRGSVGGVKIVIDLPTPEMFRPSNN